MVVFYPPDAKNLQEDELQLIEAPAFPITIPKNNIYRELYDAKRGDTSLAAVA